MREALVMLNNSLVYPYLTHCNSVWCSGPKIVRPITFSKSI